MKIKRDHGYENTWVSLLCLFSDIRGPCIYQMRSGSSRDNSGAPEGLATELEGKVAQCDFWLTIDGVSASVGMVHGDLPEKTMPLFIFRNRETMDENQLSPFLFKNLENCYVMECSDQEPLRIMVILINVIIQVVNNFSSQITDQWLST